MQALPLVLPGAGGKGVAYAVDGNDLVTTTTSAAGKTKETKKTLSSPSHASDEQKKQWKKKLREGFVYLNPRAAAFDLRFVGDGGEASGGVFDLSPDGRRLARVTRDRDRTRYAVDVVNVDDGVVTAVAAGSTPAGTSVGRALFDARGGLYFAVDGVVFHRVVGDPAPPRQVVAATDGALHPLHVRPCFDRARRRLLVVDRDAVLRVLDVEHGEASVCAVPTAAASGARCTAVALSPSGRRLALYRCSVAGYDTNAIDIVDVDNGAHLASVRVLEGLRVARLGFLPDDSALLLTWHMGRGPVCVGFDGVERWRLGDDTPPFAAHAWDFAPDDATLAVARARPTLVTLATRAERPLIPGFATITDDVRFGADGRCVAATVEGNHVVVRV